MIRAVFFDFYGTLAGWEPAAADIQRRSAAAEGLDVDPVAIDRAYPTANALLDRENAIRRIAERTPEERDAFFAEYERTLLEAAGYDVTPEQAAAIWTHVRSMPKDVAAYPDALPALEALATTGVIIGVVSNMGRDLPDYLERTGLAAFVTVPVSSEEVGFAKPHPLVFETALRKAGVSAKEALHVGDSYDSDALGAMHVGLHALYLQRDEGAKPPAGVTTIRTLMDVAGHVERLNGGA